MRFLKWTMPKGQDSRVWCLCAHIFAHTDGADGRSLEAERQWPARKQKHHGRTWQELFHLCALGQRHSADGIGTLPAWAAVVVVGLRDGCLGRPSVLEFQRFEMGAKASCLNYLAPPR